MEAVYLDTHVVISLYQKDLAAFPDAVLNTQEQFDLLVSPMVVVELGLLHESGRLRYSASKIIAELGRTIGLRVCDAVCADLAFEALDQTWTKDPFDRMIVANAAYFDAPLISNNQTIQKNYDNVIW